MMAKANIVLWGTYLVCKDRRNDRKKERVMKWIEKKTLIRQWKNEMMFYLILFSLFVFLILCVLPASAQTKANF